VWDLRRTDELAALITEAGALVGTFWDLAIRAELLYNLAAIKCGIGRPDEARPTADEALATTQASGDAWTIAMCAWARRRVDVLLCAKRGPPGAGLVGSLAVCV
jgi:hypothetical protein